MEHFVRYWPFVRSPVNASDAKFLCFLSSAPESTVEQTVRKAVIWDTIAPIMTSL